MSPLVDLAGTRSPLVDLVGTRAPLVDCGGESECRAGRVRG